MKTIYFVILSFALSLHAAESSATATQSSGAIQQAKSQRLKHKEIRQLKQQNAKKEKALFRQKKEGKGKPQPLKQGAR